MSGHSILIVAPWGSRDGGAEEGLWTILRNLDRTVLEPEVGFLAPGPFADEVAALGIRTFVIHSGRLRNPIAYVTTVMRLAELIRRRKPDVVLSWSAKVHVYQGVAATIVGRRRRAVWWQQGLPSGHWLDRLASLIPAKAIGCWSHASELAQSDQRPSRPTFVVHPGIELPRPEPIERADLGIVDDAWVVGIVGRLQPWKGQHRVIRAVAELRSVGVPAAALIVGGVAYGLSSDYERQLRRLARDLEVEEHVFFTGQVRDATPYYGLMDVFVNASDAEPFGIVLVEAMAAGLPVVAYARAGPIEIIDDGMTGLLIGENDLLTTLRRLFDDPALATRLRGNARDAAAIRFSPRGSARRFEEALLKVTER
jgi:glycosyltransferase involved in cell wall biosynthesis